MTYGQFLRKEIIEYLRRQIPIGFLLEMIHEPMVYQVLDLWFDMVHPTFHNDLNHIEISNQNIKVTLYHHESFKINVKDNPLCYAFIRMQYRKIEPTCRRELNEN